MNSVPLSNVTVWRSDGGRLANRRTSRRAIGSEALLGGRVASRILDLRSCTVSTAWPCFENIIKSASQWPGILRSAAAEGRSAKGIRPSMKWVELEQIG